MQQRLAIGEPAIVNSEMMLLRSSPLLNVFMRMKSPSKIMLEPRPAKSEKPVKPRKGFAHCLSGSAATKELWTNKQLGALSVYSPALPAHGASVVQIQPVGSDVRYETETATWIGGTHFNNNHPGYNGFGFVDGLGKAGAKLVVAVQAPADGTYGLTYRYGNATGSASTLQASVSDDQGNIVQPAKTVSFPAAGSWDTWMKQNGYREAP